MRDDDHDDGNSDEEVPYTVPSTIFVNVAVYCTNWLVATSCRGSLSAFDVRKHLAEAMLLAWAREKNV